MCCHEGMWASVPYSSPALCSRFTRKTFICDACNECQYAKGDLLEHIRQHHAHDGLAYIIWKRLWKACGFQKKGKMVRCPLCSAPVSAKNLVRHLRPKQGRALPAMHHPAVAHVPSFGGPADSCFITIGLRTAKTRFYAAFGFSRASSR